VKALHGPRRPVTTLTTGARLAQYEIIEPIGSGGMGEVYRARDPRLARDVAIKVMAPHVAADPEMRRRFETEARAVAALSHPSILAIHELAVVDGLPVAVMELLEGHTLRARLKDGPLAWREAVQIAASIAEGLAAAHARGVVHRDLKPENVFLTNGGAVKILDFGLALRRLELPAVGTNDGDDPTLARTAPHVVLGTLGYMSPEQVTGDRVDGRSDLFALGCVLYEMLSGRALFAGSTPQEIVAQLVHDRVPELPKFDGVAPKELEPIVARCIERAPSRRFDSAGDLATALRALLSGSTAVGVGRRPRSRGKSLAVLPFVNAGADPTTEYLTDGITESIINSVSQLAGLRVVPRSLVFRYKGLQADPSTIGVALNARTILSGRVSQQGEYLAIQAELVDTATESQLWGEQFRPRLSELPNVQQDIAWQISEALRLKLTGAQKKKLRKRATVNPTAYQEFLRGRYFFNAWSPEGFRRALEHFERAIESDPAYAPAYAGLGDTIGSMSYYGLIAPQEGFPRAQAAAERATALDPDLADAYGTLALGALFHRRNWTEAEQHFRRSIALNPKLATVRAFFAIFLATLGRHDESVAQARTGRDLDPLSPLVNMSVGWALYFAGRLDEAITELLHSRDLHRGQNADEPHSVMMVSYELLGRFEESAQTAMNHACFGVPVDGQALLSAWRSGGAPAYWQERLAALDRASPAAPPMIHFNYACVLTRLGRADEAMAHLTTLADQQQGSVIFFAVDPSLAPLRDRPDFDALLTRIGVPRSPMVSAPRTVST
jgi:eukaryotic-like serine/threonine-protein kinase